nr:hypothetical protein [uncultured Sphingosinicella sp.]
MSLKAFGLAALAAALLVPAAAFADPPRRGVPNGHRPPPGECRVWLPGLPPGQQPPPTDCRTARRDARQHGGRVIYGGREGRDEYRRRYRDDRYSDRDRRYYDRDDRYHDGRRGRDDRRDYKCDEKDWRKGEC